MHVKDVMAPVVVSFSRHHVGANRGQRKTPRHSPPSHHLGEVDFLAYSPPPSPHRPERRAPCPPGVSEKGRRTGGCESSESFISARTSTRIRRLLPSYHHTQHLGGVAEPIIGISHRGWRTDGIQIQNLSES